MSLKQSIYSGITKFVSRINKNRVYSPTDKVVKVNLGSGLAVYGDWYNIDVNFNILIRKLPESLLKIYYRNSGAKDWYSEAEFIDKLRKHRFIHHRFEYGLPFKDGTVDYVYSSHTLEHLFKSDADFFLKESYRILKPGGRIRICIPDLEYALSFYNSGDKHRALDYFFKQSSADYLSRHQYMYDFELLKESLTNAGFTNIQRCEYQKGQTPDLQHLDTRPEETLFAEGEKK